MDINILISNLTNPPLLYFALGTLAVMVKSDLAIPENSMKFISLYLLFAIGFKGGQELAYGGIDGEVLRGLVFGLLISAIIPIYVFFMLRRRLSAEDAGAVAASYGSVSAVTFVTAASFLEALKVNFGGHMVAVMALMESPAIISGVVLMRLYSQKSNGEERLSTIVRHSFTNGSVLMILGSLVIGFLSDPQQAQGIKPFTNDIFKGFLAIFLLEMGMLTARRLGSFRKYGFYLTAFAVLLPLFNGVMVALLSGFITAVPGDRMMFAVLAASASYIAVPAAMKIAAPTADPGLYIPMSLGITFPVNITIGLPLYMAVVAHT
ncbi:MAG TPA: sodium-dependent bicarbonate transport family permease [Bacteroidales bacterium]|nr:sodium-dependent bicarbonate transport family permease [Bacteroidales bacterium]